MLLACIGEMALGSPTHSATPCRSDSQSRKQPACILSPKLSLTGNRVCLGSSGANPDHPPVVRSFGMFAACADSLAVEVKQPPVSKEARSGASKWAPPSHMNGSSLRRLESGSQTRGVALEELTALSRPWLVRGSCTLHGERDVVYSPRGHATACNKQGCKGQPRTPFRSATAASTRQGCGCGTAQWYCAGA